MNKIIGTVALVLVAMGAWWFLAKGPLPTSSLADKVVNEDKPYYTVKAVYPGNAPAVVEQAIKATIAQFKQDSNLDNLTAEDVQVQSLGGDRKYALDITYKSYQGANTISYVFSIYQNTLGAHPNGFYRTFTFDKNGTEITLEGLFKPGSRYLDTLSTRAYGLVSAQLEEKTGTTPTPEMLDTVRIGTAPSPEALQFFYIDRDALHLLFPPYQVAAYAAGSFDVQMGLVELQDMLKPGLFEPGNLDA